jgi:tRNA uridine 5-carbamoylmethylation protein Kti12
VTNEEKEEEQTLTLEILYDPSVIIEPQQQTPKISEEDQNTADQKRKCADLNAFARQVMVELGANPNHLVELRRNLQELKLVRRQESGTNKSAV